MTVRRAAVAAIAVMVATSPAVHAGPKQKPKALPPVCRIIKDALNDTRLPSVGAVEMPAQGLDIESADIYSDGKVLRTIIRFVDLDANDLTKSGGRYQFHWSAPGSKVGVATKAEVLPNQTNVTAPLATKFTYGSSIGGNAFAQVGTLTTGEFDLDKNEIRITVPVPDIVKIKDSGSHKPLSKLYNLRAYAIFPPTGWNFDELLSTAPTAYIVTQPVVCK